jgi:hypothetical protein
MHSRGEQGHRMATARILVPVAAALAIAGCGGGSTFANRPRPPTVVDLTVDVTNQRVMVSPASVGLGPLELFVTNEASKTATLTLLEPDGGVLADTGPLNPQSTTHFTVAPRARGTYTLSAGARSGIRPASLAIGPPRPNGNNVLLQP